MQIMPTVNLPQQIVFNEHVKGLSNWVGDVLSNGLEGVSAVSSILIICTVTAMFTEFASNTATANILAPILIATAKKLCRNPIYIGE